MVELLEPWTGQRAGLIRLLEISGITAPRYALGTPHQIAGRCDLLAEPLPRPRRPVAMTPRPTLALLAIVCIVASACSGAGPGTAGPSAPTNLTDPAALDGRVFLSTKVDGPALVAGSVIRLAFEGGNISVHAGCNSMSGTYRIDGDRLEVGALATTEMACEPALMEQDRWVANLLSASTISLSGDLLTLTIDAGDQRLTLRAAP